MIIRDKITAQIKRIKDSAFLKKTKESKAFNFALEHKKVLQRTGSGAVIVLLLVILTLSIRSYNRSQQVLAPKPQSVKENMSKADEYIYNAEYDKAVQELRQLSEQGNTSALIRLCDVYALKGQGEEAKKVLAKIGEERMKDPGLWNSVILEEFLNKDFVSALKEGEEALKAFPKSKAIIKTMFPIYMANNQSDKAKVLITTYPVDYKSAYDTAEYGRMLMIAGQWDDGLNVIHHAWDTDKDEFKIYDILSQIATFDKDKLLQSLADMSTKSPDDPAPKMWTAKIYSADEDTADQASKLLESIQGKDLGKIEVKLIQASILQNTKQNDKADQLIEGLMKEYKNDFRVLHTAGWYYLNKKELDKAQKYCAASIDKNKDYPDNYSFLMPEILRAMGKGKQVEAYYRMGLLKEPSNYNAMLSMANYYANADKNNEKAMEYFRLAEMIQPKEAEIKYNIALLYLTDGKHDEGIKLLQQCTKLENINPKYHRTLGTALMLQGKTKEAITEIRYAYQADKEDPLTLNNAGCYYITAETNLERGLYNLQKAVEGLKNVTDESTKKGIQENYNRAKKLAEDYVNSSSNTSLKIPDFILFY